MNDVQTAPRTRPTVQEHLAAERLALTKHELVDGEVFAMAGGSETQSLIAANVIRELGNQPKGRPCRVYTSDMRLQVAATDMVAYPDIQVACGDARFADDPRDTLLNPKVIVEVLSESTEGWDRGGKFWHYRNIESLTGYVLVSQSAWLVEHYTGQPDGNWLLESISGKDDILQITSIHCAVPPLEIFANTRLNSESKPAAPNPETIT